MRPKHSSIQSPQSVSQTLTGNIKPFEIAPVVEDPEYGLVLARSKQIFAQAIRPCVRQGFSRKRVNIALAFTS